MNYSVAEPASTSLISSRLVSLLVVMHGSRTPPFIVFPFLGFAPFHPFDENFGSGRIVSDVASFLSSFSLRCVSRFGVSFPFLSLSRVFSLRTSLCSTLPFRTSFPSSLFLLRFLHFLEIHSLPPHRRQITTKCALSSPSLLFLSFYRPSFRHSQPLRRPLTSLLPLDQSLPPLLASKSFPEDPS